MDNVIYLYRESTDSNLSIPFPNAEDKEEGAIHSFTYTAQRMGSAPNITCTFKHPRCLDDEWDSNIIIKLKNDYYYLKKTPTSSYDNTESVYKYELTFVSYMSILDNVYFFDVVTDDNGDYRPVTNGTSVPFFGTIYELAKRINMSLRYSKLQDVDKDGNVVGGFSVVVDPYEPQHKELFTTGYLITAEDKFLQNVIQESYNTYKIPYYYDGFTIHIGFGKSGDIITESDGSPFQYGKEHSLLSIKRQNTNNKVVNRISGVGSSDNIPYYYPNETERGDIEINIEGSALSYANIVTIKKNVFINKVAADDKVEFGAFRTLGDGYLSTQYYLPSGAFTTQEEHKDGNKHRFDTKVVCYKEEKKGTATYYHYKMMLCADASNKGVFAFKMTTFSPPLNGDNGYFFGNMKAYIYDNVNSKKVKELPINFKSNVSEKTASITIGFLQAGKKEYVLIEWDDKNTEMSGIKFPVDDKTGRVCNTLYFIFMENENVSSYVWKSNRYVSSDIRDFGITLMTSVVDDMWKNPALYVGTAFSSVVTSYIYPQQNLMPSIYRESGGEERFYNAKNATEGLDDGYKDSEGNTIVFPNPYVEHKPSEHIEKFDDIKPTIVGITNSKGQRFDTFLDFAYDEDDSDETDSNGNYLHPYFFAKLPKYDGEFGFNLFDHAIDESEMTISMTSGTCGACNWVIGVEKNTQLNVVQVDENGNLIRDEKGNVVFGTAQDEQNNTQKNEVWIALKKDYETFNVLMPNAEHKYRPRIGDTFVILHIDLPKAYVLAAEKRLETKLLEYMRDNNEEQFSFSMGMSRIYLAENPSVLEKINENGMIDIMYNNKVYTLFISSYTYKISEKEALPEITLELKDSLTINSNAIENAVSKVEMNVINKINGINYAKKVADYYLNKEVDDYVNGTPTFYKGFISKGDAQFGDFAQGTSGAGIYKDENGNWHIETDFINARKRLDATSVQIQEARHIGGELILTSANCKIDFVRNIMVGASMVYRCYFQKKDTLGNTISNKWVVGDQAYCKTFNLIDKTNVQDRYYWRLVVGVSQDTEENNEIITIGNETYNLVNFHWIDLSINDCDTNSYVPMAGDSVVQLGHREKSDGTTDTNRQNAIIISGAGECSPYIREYTKINSFSLEGCLDTQLKPNDNILSGKSKFVYYKDGKEKSLDDLNDELNKGVGDLNNKFATFESEITDAIDTTTTNIEKVQETIGKLENGAVNMLLNSGFTGDYMTISLDSSSLLTEDTKMFSPSLKYWECDKNHVSVEEYEYSQSGTKVNIEAGYSISQTIPFQVHSGENYIFSFRGVGGDIYITIGGVTLGASMSNTWVRYINKFVAEQDTKIITIHATNTCSLCELQLEKGTIVSAWDISPLDNRTELARYEQLTYLQNILKSHTEIDGGIVSTGVVNSGLISMGNFNENGEMTSITAGLSGTYNTDNDPAFFAGGDMTKAISAVAAYMDNPNYEPTEEELRNMANVVITHGGRAILNDIILRGYVHALGGIFKGRVEASEGEFHGKVYAEDGEFRGKVYAKEGEFNGVLKASATYGNTIVVTDGTEKHYVIDMVNSPATTFLFEDVGKDKKGWWSLEFPNASDYEGLEINVFQRETDMSYSFMDHRVVIVPLYNDLYYSINKGIVNNASNTGTFAIRNYDTKLSKIPMNEFLSIGPNAYYKFKAINGAWYAVDGVFTGE